ncbi:MAG: hypothetical protein EKK46_05860 [Rhodocyclaceae bacterium]|nr:MAG: hypothetical protein EKK46_05860 [Rhodocyclaceae bacterium]
MNLPGPHLFSWSDFSDYLKIEVSCLDHKGNFQQTFVMNLDPDFFEPLDQKVDRVLALCDSLHEENLALRSRMAVLESEKQSLADKMDAARARLEVLRDKLPEA